MLPSPATGTGSPPLGPPPLPSWPHPQSPQHRAPPVAASAQVCPSPAVIALTPFPAAELRSSGSHSDVPATAHNTSNADTRWSTLLSLIDWPPTDSVLVPVPILRPSTGFVNTLGAPPRAGGAHGLCRGAWHAPVAAQPPPVGTAIRPPSPCHPERGPCHSERSEESSAPAREIIAVPATRAPAREIIAVPATRAPAREIIACPRHLRPANWRSSAACSSQHWPGTPVESADKFRRGNSGKHAPEKKDSRLRSVIVISRKDCTAPAPAPALAALPA